MGRAICPAHSVLLPCRFWPGSAPVLAPAEAPPPSACHCEPVHGGPAEEAKKQVAPWANTWAVTGLPGSASLWCAHAANFWMSLRGAKRRGNPHLLRQGMTESSALGESEKCCESALRITNLQRFPAGTRIAAPVCALVRNDMLKEEACVRVQGRLARGHAETWQACAGQGRNDMQRTGRCSRLQGRFPAVPPGKRRHGANFWMSLRGAKRRGNPHLLRQHEMKSNTLGESEKHYEFALRITNLQRFPAGLRIATSRGGCPAPRNDMLKEEACARVQGRLARKARRNLPGVSECRDVWRARCAETCRASASARASPHCHCEERSDVAIRISCGRA